MRSRSMIEKVKKRFTRANLIRYCLPFFVFLGLTIFFYLGAATPHLGSMLTTSPGDQLSGPIRLFYENSSRPFFGFSTDTNYPVGEQLSVPTLKTGSLELIPMWILTKLANPIFAYNVFTAFGFIFSAYIAYLFVYRLTRRMSVSYLGGFAVTFTSYIQLQTGIHPSYVFEGVFILIIWTFITLWKRPKLLTALLLAVFAASTFYTDGYFVLFVVVTLLACFTACIVMSWKSLLRKQYLLERLKYFVIAGVAGLVLIGPIMYVQHKQGSQVNAFLASERSNIYDDAQAYGAHPREYILPNGKQETFNKLGINWYKYRDLDRQNWEASAINLSLTIVVVLMACAAIVFWKRKKEPLDSQLQTYLVLFGLLAIVAFMFSLPPRVFGVRTPVDVLIHFTAYWRVFARLSVLVNMGIAIVAVLLLHQALKNIKKTWQVIAIVGVVFVGVFLEYITFNPLTPKQGWTFAKDAPAAYIKLAHDPSIKVVAEYPLQQYPAFFADKYPGYIYFTHKKIINPSLPNVDQNRLHDSITSLTSPQTIVALRSLGVDAVIVHQQANPGNIPGLQLLYASSGGSQSFGVNTWVYKVLDGPTDRYILAPDFGFVAQNAGDKMRGIYTMNSFSTSGKLVFLQLPTGDEVGPNISTHQQVTIGLTSSNPACQVGVNQGARVLVSAKGLSSVFTFDINSTEPIVLTANGQCNGQVVLSSVDLTPIN